ncbi:MAG: TlpA disulfide reductase family protein [Nanoarchaeota archaeon]
MKLRTFLIIAAIVLFLVIGCSAELTTKKIEEKQPLNQVIETGTKKGEAPPDFVARTTEGKAIVLGNLLRSNKPVIIYFFATWCPYCHQDLTALSKVYKEYSDKVSIIAMSLDLSEDSEKIGKYKATYPELQSVMFAPGTRDILIKYNAIRTTTKFAIGKNGTVIYSGFGAFDDEQWKTLLDRLVKE